MIVIAIPLVALLGTTSASLLLQQSESQQRTVSLAARALSNAADQVLSDAVNAETSIRGYAATRDPSFLAPYNLTLTRIGAERKALREAALAEGDSRQQRMVDATTGKVFIELAQLRSAIGAGATVRSLGPPLLEQKASMDLLRRQVASLADGPAALVVLQRAKITRLTTIIDLLDIVGLALGLLAGLAGVALFTSGVARRVGANAVNAGRLGEGQPLEPAAYAGDEIGQVGQSLVRAEALLASRAAELTTARDEAMSATQAKNSFLSSTSHELRTPLNSILGFTQLLQMSELSDEDSDGVERILGAGRHLLALINELIDIARIESGDLSLSLEPVLVRPIIAETSQLMAPIGAERSIQIIQDCAHPALAVQADRQRLSQVLVNLISNAVKYNHRGGTVTISCQEEGTGHASIVVPDFIASLPRAPDLIHVPAPGLAPAPLAARHHGPAGASISILYIEDNPANVELISRYLHSRPKTRLRSETSGRAGIERAVRDMPDIILLDLHLPDLHGDQVLSELKSEPATAAIPVVVLSADASRGVIRRLLAGGALAYLTKPIELAELGKLLDTFTAAQAQDQQAQPAIRIMPA